jgi:hypothetical protein
MPFDDALLTELVQTARDVTWQARRCNPYKMTGPLCGSA